MFQATLILAKTPSIYATHKHLREYPNRAAIDSCLELPDVLYTSNYQKKAFPSIHAQLTAYKLITKKNYVPIEINPPKSGWGRIVPTGSLTISLFHRPTRHTVCRDNYTDLDFKNCQPEIFNHICKLHNLHCPQLQYYCDNRDAVLNQIMAFHDCSRDIAKKLIISILNGGTYENWIVKHQRHYQQIAEIIQFQSEWIPITNTIYEANPHIIKDILASKKITYDPADIAEYKRTFMAAYYQTIERVAQETCITYLVANKQFDIRKIVPCQDGFMILKALYYSTLLAECNSIILNLLGFPLILVVKEFDEGFPVAELVIPAVEAEPETDSYEAVKAEFEKTHCKIIDTVSFINITNSIQFKERQLIEAYRHIKCKILKKELVEVEFIPEWIRDKDIKVYQKCGVYPPPRICPTNELNLWIPFQFESNYADATADATKCIQHIETILCDNSKETFSEVEKWIAHSIQAAGGKKPYALTFIGKEGGGKSWLIELLKKMYGGRVLQTASPERDVWGTYNPLMATAYLVNLNEVDKRNTKGADGKIKQLISEDRITVSSKGQNAYEIDSYNRFILTTNALDGAGTDDNDRRNMIMRCSDSKVGDSDYFKELFSLLENTEVMRAVYKHFRTLDISTWNPAKAPLKTEYHTTIIGETKSNIQQYMEHFTYKHSTEESVELYGKDIYTDYKQWNEEQGNEYKMALNDLLKKIKLTYRAVIISSKRDNKGMKNTYSILELKRLFNIGELLI